MKSAVGWHEFVACSQACFASLKELLVLNCVPIEDFGGLCRPKVEVGGGGGV